MGREPTTFGLGSRSATTFPAVLQWPAAESTCIINDMADSPLNVYLRSLKAILADAEQELPPKTWRSLREIVLLALQARVRRSGRSESRRAA